MPTEIRLRSWRELWQGFLDRLPVSDHPIEPEISAEVFVHGEAQAAKGIKAPPASPASDQPKSR